MIQQNILAVKEQLNHLSEDQLRDGLLYLMFTECAFGQGSGTADEIPGMMKYMIREMSDSEYTISERLNDGIQEYLNEC